MNRRKTFSCSWSSEAKNLLWVLIRLTLSPDVLGCVEFRRIGWEVVNLDNRGFVFEPISHCGALVVIGVARNEMDLPALVVPDQLVADL
ncbi:MAG: hypothetical protein V1792_21630 [Pseudomonadota bacterium]